MTSSATPDSIRADFDRIATLWSSMPDFAGPYERWLLRRLPARMKQVLDVGCGAGFMSRAVAGRSEQVLAIDLSPGMIELARARSASFSNIDYRIGDVMNVELPRRQFDCVVSVATLHHLPMPDILLNLRESLAPGGVLAVIDLVRSTTIRDRVLDLLAFPVNLLARLIEQRRLIVPSAMKQAWAQHGSTDSYLRLSEVRDECDAILPGAQIRRHLRWRYSLIWRKP